MRELTIHSIMYKPVRKGTNGGVTLQGLLAATAGGLTIGLTFVAVGLMTAECSFKTGLRQLLVIPISAAAGLLGSLIDSLLGATLQFSGYCSVRKKVNFSVTLRLESFFQYIRAMIHRLSKIACQEIIKTYCWSVCGTCTCLFSTLGTFSQ
jgi:uncharacterized membrane protein